MAAKRTERDPFAERQAEQRTRRAATCEHFTGLPYYGERERVCRAGVAYDGLADSTEPGMALRLPCFPAERVDPRYPRASCSKFKARGAK